MTINSTYFQNAGFFAQLQGTIKNTIFVNENISITNSPSAINWTYVGGVCGYCNGTIQNCRAFGAFSAAGDSLHNCAAGIAGRMSAGANIGIYDCMTNHSSCIGVITSYSIHYTKLYELRKQ